MPLLQLMLGSPSDCTRDVQPDAWRRFLGILTDGPRTRRDGPSPLPQPSLRPAQVQRTMRSRRPSAR